MCLAPDPRATTRPQELWTSSSPHVRQAQETTMCLYHQAPTRLGGPDTKRKFAAADMQGLEQMRYLGANCSVPSIPAAPGLWGDSYRTMAAAGGSYWYEPPPASTNTSSGKANHNMSASAGKDPSVLDHHALDHHGQESYTTPESGMFLGSMEWNSKAIARGVNAETQHCMTSLGYTQAKFGRLPPADQNHFAESALSNTPTGTTPNCARSVLGADTDDRWQRRGSSATLSTGSDNLKRGQLGRKTRQTSAAQGMKSKREHSYRAAVSPQRGTKEARTSDRTKHNDVERKYRMNLKGKFAELRAAIPDLKRGSEEEGSDTGMGATGNDKVSKRIVLSKAAEYIHELEAMNRNMATELYHLAQRLRKLECQREFI